MEVADQPEPPHIRISLCPESFWLGETHKQNRHLAAMSLWQHHGTTIPLHQHYSSVPYCSLLFAILGSFFQETLFFFISMMLWYPNFHCTCLFLDFLQLLCHPCSSLLLMPFTYFFNTSDKLHFHLTSIYTWTHFHLPEAQIPFSTSFHNTWLLIILTIWKHYFNHTPSFLRNL